jgi:hypothetical protein
MPRPEKSSTAINPGDVIPVDAASTPVFDADDLDKALFVVFQNNSDEFITLHFDVAGAAPFEGIVLNPGGGTWREDQIATAVCACHHGASGTKDLSVVVFG